MIALYNILRDHAKNKKVIFYHGLREEYNSITKNNHKTEELFPFLIEVGDLCLWKGEPPLNCLVILGGEGKPPIPSDGFYKWILRKYQFNFDVNILEDVAMQKMVFEIFKGLCFHYWDIKTMITRGGRKKK